MQKREYLPYLKTLRRIPDDIILSMATRNFDMLVPNVCLCGWAWREALDHASKEKRAALTVGDDTAMRFDSVWCYTDNGCRKAFGGTSAEWSSIYGDADMPVVETAFTVRLEEAVK